MNALTQSPARASLEPQTLTEAMRFAETLASSTMVPRDYQRNPANVLVAIQWGRELGLGPLQAMQNIAVINGRPSVWGDAALALVRGHPACRGVAEGVDGEGDERFGWCEVTRAGERAQRRTFSVADAKRAGLWGKTGPWTQYPDRMLQLRARGFALRDVFPDALRGVGLAEEVQDGPAEEIPPARGPVIDAAAAIAPGLVPWAPHFIAANGKRHDAVDVATWEADWMKRIKALVGAERRAELRDAWDRNAAAIMDVAARDEEAADRVVTALREALPEEAA